MIKLVCVFFMTLTNICALGQAIPVASISSETVNEGMEIFHTVTLSSISSIDETYDLVWSLDFNTVDFEDFNNSFRFEGIFFVPSMPDRIIVPAGSDSFTVSSIAFNDNIEEDEEFYTITISAMTATGTIIDNDFDTIITSISDDSETEGNDLVHNVFLSNPISSAKRFSISVKDITTDIFDYNTILFSEGISYDSMTEMIMFPRTPNGIQEFSITVPTVDDMLIEDDESYTVMVGNRIGTGTIIDNDTVTITSISDGSKTEGKVIVHTVELSNTNPELKTFMFAIYENSATTSDYSAPLFNNGVTFNSSTSLITVPALIDSFTVSIPTIDDFFEEDDEIYDVRIEDTFATGTIVDNDTFTVPKFFTPNNDGVHDTWPYDLAENDYIYDNSIIYIYNRYGKFIKQLNPPSGGWDGLFNNIQMPSNDYWFKIIWANGDVMAGHFTLKR
ncbi:gliding motility-associated C-terminal domain-containing protein [Maribacter dokdonensis]|uniref:Gliding motility-associated C-terminal domain-containing protein n=2 Tax=Maribacter dokdonensis TaxID=320912 RepID=A0A1H4UUA5_9FLAO|nr:gliding motility-associated C-terminal domain-containing protein [Maribacter dokdonensis]